MASDTSTGQFTPDYFFNWLRFANAGMLAPQNITAIMHAAERISDKPVLEIGSFCGLSTNVISYAVRAYRKTNRIFACDKWMFEGAEAEYLGKSDIKHVDYRLFVIETFKRNVEFFSHKNKPFAIEALSDELFEAWAAQAVVTDLFGRQVKLGGPLSFCYIDGAHTYECAKRDFENTDKHLEIGGFVLFDDSADDDRFGLTRLMREVASRGDYRVVMKNPNYLFRRIA